MPIVTCPHCARKIDLPFQELTWRIGCKACKQVFIPLGGLAEPPPVQAEQSQAIAEPPSSSIETFDWISFVLGSILIIFGIVAILGMLTHGFGVQGPVIGIAVLAILAVPPVMFWVCKKNG